MTDALLSWRDEDDALAGEYVLGVLSLVDRQAVEARMKADPAFAALVAAWERRLSPLNDDYETAPAPNLLPRIEARLFPKAQGPGSALLRWLSGLAVAASLVIILVATLTPPRQVLVATLATADARLVYEVRSFGETLQVTRVAGDAADEGQVHELWLLAQGAAPVSLGLLGTGPLIVTYPVPPAGWSFAVSVEPPGGVADRRADRAGDPDGGIGGRHLTTRARGRARRETSRSV